MTAMPYQPPEHEWDEYEHEETPVLPGRPRRQLWTRGTAMLLAVLLGAVGFYAGVRVEKGQLSNSTSATGAPAGAAAAARARAGGLGGGAGGLAARFGAGNGTFGTVSAVNRNSLYLTDATGNTVKISFNAATKVTKSGAVPRKAIRPGDTVVIQGLKGSNGNIAATSVSDSGARAGNSGGGGGSSTTNNASSAVNSLFGSG